MAERTAPGSAPAEARSVEAVSAPDADAFASWAAGLRERLAAEAVILAMGPRDTGPFTPCAEAFGSRRPGEALTTALDLVVAQRRPIVKSGFVEAGETSCAVGVPILMDGALHGAVAVQLPVRADLDLRRVVEDVEWALPAVRVRLLDQALQDGRLGQARARAAVELLSATLDEARWSVAAATAVTDLADRLGCDRVSYGIRRRLTSRVVALSHSGGFSRRSELVQRIADAMDEAIDQGQRLQLPEHGQDRLTLTAAHDALIAVGAPRAVLTVPLRRDGKVTGAMVFERAATNPFRAADVDLIEAVCGILGPVLEEKRLNDRSLPVKIGQSLGRGVTAVLGPRRAGLKALVVLAAVAGWMAWHTEAPFRITANARVEGAIRRVISAPMDGYVASAAALPGDTVAAGTVLATLDDRDIQLEIVRWQTVRAQRQREYDNALASRDRAASGIAASQISQADAELSLLQERLDRTQIRAPFDAIVLAGDLDQSVGAPVARGQVLYEIAPLDAYRIVLAVDERDLALVHAGLAGEVVLTALPGQSFQVETGQVTSVAGVEDGRNVFRVDASLVEPSSVLRPGMEGIAKIDIDERPLPLIWTRGLRDWARMALWRWQP